ncbi:MAG: class SAM-dependent methyltransferase [Devosia sp.]|uniref:class I SAM-dependent DNA methyltransferase n=1 Tax=Devosia sp. TaxID=1871048 RepID=UPI00261F36B5|nr:class I SAM-dependent methyltransferase [Devosia sp.]MDB5530491.1 class SAM-dependent methyltransferase [Devosia sp.]
MPDNETLRFYAENAATYVAHPRQLPQHQLDAFLAALPPSGDILELGTGGGQDAAHMLARGFAVTPTDASPELAANAEALLGRKVTIMAFNQLAAVAEFDGVWACAALLHAPASELTDNIARIHRALRPGGHLTASFKAGTGEGRDALGRYYNYPSAETLLTHFRAAADWAALDLTESDGGGYDGKPTRWLWVQTSKAPA